jgi:hypothetical protein
LVLQHLALPSPSSSGCCLCACYAGGLRELATAAQASLHGMHARLDGRCRSGFNSNVARMAFLESTGPVP